MVINLWYTNILNLGSQSWLWRCKENPCPFSPDFGLWGHWRFLNGGWHLDLNLDMVTEFLNFGSLSWFRRFKDHHVLQVLIWDFGGHWRFLTKVWHLDLDMVTGLWDTNIPNFGFLHHFECENKIHVHWVPIWAFGGCWRFLTGVLHLHLYLDIVRNLAWIFPEVFISLRLVKAKIE